MTPKTLFAFGLNHSTAPVEVREKLYLREAEIPSVLERFNESLSECLILSTCNRTEIYGVSDRPDVDLSFYKNLLLDVKDARGLVRDEHFFNFISCAACEHLFSVATSINSSVIGDSQILRQLRSAYFIARDNNAAGKIINQLLQRAFKLGKRTYTHTSIHDGAASISLAAVQLAMETFGSLQGRTALVIGAGQTARLTAEALANKRIGKILVSNRTRSHAEELLSNFAADLSFERSAIDFENFKDALADVDIVISSTGSVDPILFRDDFAGVRRRMLVVDIAVPRDVDTSVGTLAHVVLRDIDDLNSIVGGNREKRMKDLPTVKKMIMTEMVEFLTWYYALPLMPEYVKTGVKPHAAQIHEILNIKEFLKRNVGEIHRLATRTGDDFSQDLENHFSLVEKLQMMKAEAFAN